MKKLDETIVNKYLDNELNAAEISSLKDYLNEDESLLDEFRIYESVHHALKSLSHETAPDISDAVMARVGKKSMVSDAKILNLVVLFFSTGIIAGFGYLLFLYGIDTGIKIPEINPSLVEGVISTVSIYTSEIFNNNVITFVGMALGFIALSLVYVLYEHHKQIKSLVQHHDLG